MYGIDDIFVWQDLRELHYEEQMIVMPAKEVLNLGVRAMTIYLRRLREAIQEGKLALTGMALNQASDSDFASNMFSINILFSGWDRLVASDFWNSLTLSPCKQIPKEVYDMIDLKDLSVDKNGILEIESSILHFDELEVLSANMNNVENLNFLLGDPRKPPW